MKKFVIIILIGVSVVVCGVSGNISMNYFESDLYFPVFENIYFLGSISDKSIGGGVALDFNWEKYSTGFLKIKENDGSFGFGIKYLEDITLFSNFEFNNSKIPFFSHSYFDGSIKLNKDFSLYTRNWIRLPIVVINIGGQLVTYNKNDYSFNDLSTYIFNPDWKRSIRFKYIDKSAILGLDLHTSDTLGEFGYGGGVCYNFENKKIGLSLFANLKADMKISKFTLSPTVVFTSDNVLLQLLITRLGVKETFSMGITVDDFKIKGFFLRFEL